MNLFLQLLNGNVGANALLFVWGVQIIIVIVGIASIANRSQAGSN